ncbi:hypothetical protein L9F63_017335 [Diploptera punctata]|uniref:Nuclear pore complex protein Nup85 n=1 Tax=Diploptera punctata TaxID=6984 RepID=A0AAD7ZZ05_DIPPU|nr:hypothetical protein L9F63_017335 [Diploptera punctata]
MGEQAIFAIPDEVCEKAGLAAVWTPAGKLGTYAYRHVTVHSKDQASEFAPCTAMVHNVRTSILLFNPITRKLINESNGTFIAVQKLASNAAGQDIRAELLKFSRQYRSIVRAALENLQAEVKEETDLKDSCMELIAIFYNVEFVWHLCEILFVDYTPGDVVLPQLIEWVRFHFFHVERQAKTLLADISVADCVGAELEPEYWDTLIDLVLQGRLETARDLLRRHSQNSTEPFKLIDKLMRTMPLYNIYGNVSLGDFNLRWRTWRNEVKELLDLSKFSSRTELELLVKLLAGDADTFLQVKDHCKTWYHFMASWLLYSDPVVKTFDLSYHARQCIEYFGTVSNLKNLDKILLALMESDLHQVIKLVDQTTENGWFAAHITDLLYHSGCLKALDNPQDMDIGSNLHEHLMLEYGTMLMSHHSLWQVGISYLDYCPKSGRAYLEALLPTLPLRTEARALKIIQIAREREMSNIVASICKIMGMRSYKRHRLGNALTWALRSQDAGFATYLANKFLELYSLEGKFHSMDLLDNLGSCMLVSDRLTFLGKYCEFHQLYHAGEFRDAAVLLVSLLASRLAPKTFWMTLLTDALPLLESNDIVFTSEDTYELLNCMEELLGEGYIPDVGGQYSADKPKAVKEQEPLDVNIMEDKVKLTRLALARNLARALNHEGCLLD